MPADLRPMSTGELLDKTFSLYRHNFRLLFGIACGPYLALLVCQIAIRIPFEMRSHRVLSPFTGRGFWLFAGGLLVSSLVHAAITYAVSALHLRCPVTISSAYTALQPLIGVVFAISIVLTVSLVLGVLLLLIPAVFVITSYSLAQPAAVLEGLGVAGSLRRSRKLSSGARGRVFLVFLLFLIVSLAIGIGMQQLSKAVFGSIVSTTPAAVIFRTISFWLQAVLLSPLASMGMTLLYYDQRIRKEGFDVQQMLAELSAGNSASAAVF